jgi:hypothetical protein
MARNELRDLPGRNLTVEEAARDAEAVVVADLIELGQAEPAAVGKSYFGGARIRVVETLRGTAARKTAITFLCQTFPEDQRERPPAKGERLLFFLRKTSDGLYRAVKIAPPDHRTLDGIRQK